MKPLLEERRCPGNFAGGPEPLMAQKRPGLGKKKSYKTNLEFTQKMELCLETGIDTIQLRINVGERIKEYSEVEERKDQQFQP